MSPFKLGPNEPNKLYVGSQEVQKVYRGSTEVWPGTDTAPGQEGDGSVTITPSRTIGIAPAAVYFIATATGFIKKNNNLSDALAAEHELSYQWNFGDTVTDNFRAFDAKPSRMAKIGGVDCNSAVGPHAAHAFAPTAAAWTAHGSGPMEFTVTCTVTDGTNTVTSSPITIMVENPEEVFDETNTFVVANDGVFADAPIGNQINQTNLRSVLDNNIGALDKIRIRLKRGTTGYLGFSKPPGLTGKTIMVDAWGSGNAPEVDCYTTRVWDNPNVGGGEVILTEFDILGGYNPDLVTATNSAEAITTATEGCHVTVYRIRADGTDRPFAISGDASTYAFAVDCEADVWKSYGAFLSSTGGGAYVGCRFHAKPGGTQYPAAGDNPGAGQGTAGGAPFRMTSPADLSGRSNLFSRCDVYSNISQSGSVMQACFRINTNGEADVRVRISEVCAEGGSGIVIANAASSGKHPNKMDGLIENSILMCAHAPDALSFEHTGFTVKNCIIFRPQVNYQYNNSNQVIRFFDKSGNTTNTGVLDGFYAVYSNTIVSWYNGSNGEFAQRDGGSAIDDFVYENNLYFNLRAPSPSGDISWFDLSGDTIETVHLGAKLLQSSSLDTTKAAATTVQYNSSMYDQFGYPQATVSAPQVIGPYYAPRDLTGKIRTDVSKQGAIDL